MVEKELQELELAMGEYRLFPFVAQHPTVWIEPQTLELPDPGVPKVEPVVVPRHLVLDKGDVHFGGFLGHRMEFGQFPLDPL